MHYICNKRQCRQPSRAYWYCCRFCTYFRIQSRRRPCNSRQRHYFNITPRAQPRPLRPRTFQLSIHSKGQWAFGLTASYGEFNSEDVEVLSVIKDFNFKGKLYSIKPSVSYFFKSNQSLGLKFDYTRGIADLANLNVDFDEDLSFSIHDVSYYSQSYSMSLFYRNYVGLGKEKRFAVFNEVDLGFGSGSSRFKRYYNDELRDTRTISTTASLNFSPGLCVFIQDVVSFNVSFGVFGIKYKKERQSTNGVDEGSRVSSGANFRFNIFNINFGMAVVI